MRIYNVYRFVLYVHKFLHFNDLPKNWSRTNSAVYTCARYFNSCVCGWFFVHPREKERSSMTVDRIVYSV